MFTGSFFLKIFARIPPLFASLYMRGYSVYKQIRRQDEGFNAAGGCRKENIFN